jgi:hypothetical protein
MPTIARTGLQHGRVSSDLACPGGQAWKEGIGRTVGRLPPLDGPTHHAVREGKTTGESALELRRNPLPCPRETWLRWRETAALHDGPALRPVRSPHPGRRALSPDAVTRLLTHAGVRVRPLYRVTGHSLRSGFATAAHGAGWQPLDIARHGRWADNSAELWGYIHEQRWRRPSEGFDIEPSEEDLVRR